MTNTVLVSSSGGKTCHKKFTVISILLVPHAVDGVHLRQGWWKVFNIEAIKYSLVDLGGDEGTGPSIDT